MRKSKKQNWKMLLILCREGRQEQEVILSCAPDADDASQAATSKEY